MAQSKYIQSVLDAAGGRPKSTQWYRDKIKEFGKPGAMDLIRDEIYSDGFLGINFHYLPIPLRIRLLDRLVDFSNDTDFDEQTRLIVEYQTVKKIRLVKPTIHKYLAGQVKSQFRRIDADEFMIATLLPVQRFKKAAANEVWKDSRGMI